MTVLGMLLGSDIGFAGERNPLDDRWYGAGTQLSLTGIKVDQNTALNLSTCWACVSLFASSIGMLPMGIMRKRGQAYEPMENHPAYYGIHDEPNPDMGVMMYRSPKVIQQINAGNAFSEIERSKGGQVRFWPIHHSRVNPVRNKDRSLWWQVKNDAEPDSFIPDTDMIHVASMMSHDGIMGKGVIAQARETIGFGLALEREGAARFANAGRPEVVIEGAAFENPEAREMYRNTWTERHVGYQNRGKPALLPKNSKIHVLEYSAVDQQYLESCKFAVEQICRWYRCPPHMVQHLDRATWANAEELAIEFVIYDLMPWLVLWEDEFSRKVLTEDERRSGLRCRFMVEELLRGNSAARAAYLNTMVNQVGALNVNEARGREGLGSIGPQGDKYRCAVNMTTLDKLGETPPTPAPVGRPPENNAEPQTDGASLMAFGGAMMSLVQSLRSEVRQLAKRAKPRRKKADIVPPLALSAPDPRIEEALTAANEMATKMEALRQAERDASERIVAARRETEEVRLAAQVQSQMGLDRIREANERMTIAKDAALANLLDVSRVIVRQEVQKIQAVAKRPAKFLADVEEFYGKHAARMTAMLDKPVDVLGVLTGRRLAIDLAIREHINKAQAELLTATECQPEQLEERVNAVLRRWDVRAEQLTNAIAKTLAATPLEGPSVVLDDFPDVRQPTHWSCGAAASMAVGKFFGVGPDTIEEWIDALGTTEEKSTAPQAIIDYLRSLGLDVEVRDGMTIDDLEQEFRKGRPVICPVQDYSGQRSPKAAWDMGHWLAGIGRIPGSVVVQDSALDNAEKLPGGSVSKAEEDPTDKNIGRPGRKMVAEKEWMVDWHDIGEDKQVFDRYGISVGQKTEQQGSLSRGILGGPGSGPQGGRHPKEATPTERTKSEIAKSSATRVGADIQRYAEEHNEPALAKGLGGHSLKDNEPVDVVSRIDGKTHGIELKTMVSNKADKITMKADAQARKAKWQRKEPGTCHTVVFDDRKVKDANGPGKHDESKRVILYRRGFGSFRTSGMYEVKGGMKELKELITMDRRKLPKGAK